MNGVSTIQGVTEILSAGLAGKFAAAAIRLTATIFGPSETTLPADIVAPGITGYTPEVVTWGAVSYDPVSGLGEAAGTATYQFTGPADGTGKAIIGWGYVDPAGGGTVLSSGLFDVAIPLITPLDTLTLAIRVKSSGMVTITVV